MEFLKVNAVTRRPKKKGPRVAALGLLGSLVTYGHLCRPLGRSTGSVRRPIALSMPSDMRQHQKRQRHPKVALGQSLWCARHSVRATRLLLSPWVGYLGVISKVSAIERDSNPHTKVSQGAYAHALRFVLASMPVDCLLHCARELFRDAPLAFLLLTSQPPPIAKYAGQRNPGAKKQQTHGHHPFNRWLLPLYHRRCASAAAVSAWERRHHASWA